MERRRDEELLTAFRLGKNPSVLVAFVDPAEDTNPNESAHS